MQEGKGGASGQPIPAGCSAVTVSCRDGKDNGVFSVTPSTVAVGGTVRVGTQQATETSCVVSGCGATQQIEIHTSCSKRLATGDVFGAMIVRSFQPGCGSTCPSPPPPSCYESPDQCPTNCDACFSKDYKPSTLTLTYTGGPATVSNPQEGKASASGQTLTGQTASVSCFGKKGNLIGGANVVMQGASFDLSISDSETSCTITSAGGTQRVTMHTSCSKPLNIGDQYGALRLTDLTLRHKSNSFDVRTGADFCPPCVLCCEMGELTVPDDRTEECDGMGNRGALEHFIKAATCRERDTGKALPVTWTATPFKGPTSCHKTTEVTWNCTDDCGNEHTQTKRFTIIDTTPPAIVRRPDDLTIQCSDYSVSSALWHCSLLYANVRPIGVQQSGASCVARGSRWYAGQRSMPI